MNVSIIHDKKYKKFYVQFMGKECSLRYELLTGNVMDLKLLFVPKNFRNRQVEGVLMTFVINYARKYNLKIKPSCAYVKYFFDACFELQDILDTKENEMVWQLHNN